MNQLTLSPAERDALRRHLDQFRKYLSSEEFARDQEDRVRRVHFFQRELPDRVSDLSEVDVTDLVENLYSTRMWGNRAYLVHSVIADNGIAHLRVELRNLLDKSRPPEQRYERFVQRVRRLGPAAASEMLCYLQPDACGIWNQKSRQALDLLGLSRYVDVRKYALTAPEYAGFNALLGAIARELQAAGIPHVDLLMVDYFLYEVARLEKRPLPDDDEFDHDEIKEMIRGVGEMLGFDTDTEVQVTHGARLDVVWRARIANLGMVTYVFEVHKGGSVDSLLMNLYKAKASRTVQRVVAVSSTCELERVKKESAGLPSEFREAMSFWEVCEVKQVSEWLRSAAEVITRLGLGESVF